MTLTTRAYFTILENGKPKGLVVALDGTVVPVVEVKPEHLVIMYNGVPQPLPFEQCDIVARLGGEAAILQMPDDSQTPPAPPPQAPKTDGANDEKALLRKLVSVRSHWPKNVRLLERCSFQTFDAGKLIGSKPVEPDTILRLISIGEDGVVVALEKSLSEVRPSQIDLIDHMGGAAAILALPDDPENQSASAR